MSAGVDLATWARALGGRTHLYASASCAYEDLLIFLRAIGRRARPNVVLPSYLPARLWRATLAAGCEARFHDVGARGAPELASLEAAVDEDTIAVLAVHYFGFPQRVDEVAAIARRRGAVLIEDCAQALAGHDALGRALGTLGDAAIFSMRKMLLYSEGGMLRVGDALLDFHPRYRRRVASAWSAHHFLRQRAKRLYARVTGGADPLGLLRGASVDAMDWSAPQQLPVQRLSRFTQLRLRASDVARAVRRRRAAYQRIAESLPRVRRFRPLFPALPAGVTPSSFPLFVLDGSRDALRAGLLRRGVVAGAGWPEAPFDPSHHGAAELAAGVLELPVDQALGEAQIERAIRAMRELAAAPSRC